MRLWEWIAFIVGVLLIGTVMIVVFLFSFGFALKFWPFIILFGMIRGLLGRVRDSGKGWK